MLLARGCDSMLPRRWPANFQSRGKRYTFNENLNGVHFCNTLRLHLHLP
jgi:hypothetical protein